MTLKKMILCALFAAFTAVCSQIALPLPFTPVPVNLATLSVITAGVLLGAQAATVSQLVYLLAGAVGLPVFARFQGGIAVLLGPTGGYLIGYVAAAFITGWISENRNGQFFWHCIAMAAGVAACYFFGTVWYIVLTHSSPAAALIMAVIPFLPGDGLKILAGAFLAKSLRPHLLRTQSSSE